MYKNLVDKNMKYIFKLMTIITVLTLSLAGCGETMNEGYRIKGSIKGIQNDKLKVKPAYKGAKEIIVEVKDGCFEIKGEALKEPCSFSFFLLEEKKSFYFYVDNGEMLFEGELGKRDGFPAIITKRLEGCDVNDHISLLNSQYKAVDEKYNLSTVKKEDLKAVLENMAKEKEDIKYTFIKANPNAYWTGLVAKELTHGMDADEIKEVLKLIDPELDTPHLRELKLMLAKMEETDVELCEITQAPTIPYKVDKDYKGNKVTGIRYLSVLSDNKVCALCKGREIKIMEPSGKEASSFKLKKSSSVIATDAEDQIYTFHPIMEVQERKVRGKLVKKKVSKGHECIIYDRKGRQIKTFEIKGLAYASGARVVENKLLIADVKRQLVAIYDAQTGKLLSEMKEMRPCCGILDFSINPDNELLIANLGAFRVQKYDLDGKLLLTFGKRGKELDNFHGCCNPVSVAFLSNGAIVTVEKDSTRIKIFGKDGAKVIDGIDELVQGCEYIPMIVDAKDNLYLASAIKGIVKCVPVK